MNNQNIKTLIKALDGLFPGQITPDLALLFKSELAKYGDADMDAIKAVIEASRWEVEFLSPPKLAKAIKERIDRANQDRRARADEPFWMFQRRTLGLPESATEVETIMRWHYGVWQRAASRGASEFYRTTEVSGCKRRLLWVLRDEGIAERAAESITYDSQGFEMAVQDVVEHIKATEGQLA
jgi:hypothetical protein